MEAAEGDGTAGSCRAVRGLVRKGKLWLIFCALSGRPNAQLGRAAAALASGSGEGHEPGQDATRSRCGELASLGPFRTFGNFPLTFRIHGRISSPDVSCTCSRLRTDMQSRDLPPQPQQAG